jgi:alkyl sulfatase BDS1-like metallo-beta-lactamase superfamily hydrolase
MADDECGVPASERQVARQAFAEAARLLRVARRTYDQGEYRKAASALAALASVFAPLDEHVQRTWVASAAGSSPVHDRVLPGAYL